MDYANQVEYTEKIEYQTFQSNYNLIYHSENFDTRGRWDGNENDITIFSGDSQKWKALATSTKEKYQKLSWELEPTLNRSKGLMSTIEVSPQGKSSITISANSPYAAIHHYGGT